MRLPTILARGCAALSLALAAPLAGCARGADPLPDLPPPDDAASGGEPAVQDDAGADVSVEDSSEAAVEAPADGPAPDHSQESGADAVGPDTAPQADADAGKDLDAPPETFDAGPCVCDVAGCGTCPTVATISIGGGRIDSIEVTNGQYAAFLASNPKTADQAADCAWNASFVPVQGWPAAGKETYPVGHVDWCDATAFCRWAKKRLCGKLGGGPNAYADFAAPDKSHWFKACSGGGAKTYPYGNAYVPANCNGADYGKADKIPAGQADKCIGAFPGLYDMSGNVWEWEDSCSGTGPSAQCRMRGGSYTNGSNALACGVDSAIARDSADATVGFRCCSD
jgi:hypothetical protein